MSRASAAFALTAPAIFDGEQTHQDHCLVIRDGDISALLPLAQCPDSLLLQSLPYGLLAPGFVDLQVNGGGDVLLQNSPTEATLHSMLDAHRALGTTALLPTLLSAGRKLQQEAADVIARFRAGDRPGVLGLHLEGPFFHPQRRGAHAAEAVRKPTAADVDWLCALQGFPVMVTVAPEQLEVAQLEQLARNGIQLCAGHTEASYEQMNAAAALGLRGVTHLFNAMGPLATRAPGALGAALDNDKLWAGIIADGHHVHPANIRLAFRAKPPGKLVLVSDAMATAGGSHDTFELYGEQIRLCDGRLVNSEGVLAGSAIGLIDAVRYCHQVVGIPLEDCLRMASRYPASVIGEGERRGRLAPGFQADIVHLDDDLSVCATWVAGRGNN